MPRTSLPCLSVLLLWLMSFAHAEEVLIRTRDGVTLSATLVLPDLRPGQHASTILVFDIHSSPEVLMSQAAEFAARGYAGIVADVRGKQPGSGQPVPYEHDAVDTHAVLDWIVAQPWSDGKVGMVGGGYSGFAAWAATKRKHPALRGIAVSAAVIPGQGSPVYDKYWQSMVPYKQDFARITIPVLSITGYYDAAQISALQYFTQHAAFGRNPEHYLVIGPYDHPATHARRQAEKLRNYTIDPVAKIDAQELKLQFMDYVLKGEPRPALLSNTVNYQVMGANVWRHAPSFGSIHGGVPMRLYFSARNSEGLHALVNQQPPLDSVVTHEVQMAERVKLPNFDVEPMLIVQGPLSDVTASTFMSQPFEAATVISGAFTGELLITVNKKDFDLGVTVYEAMPGGKLFLLGYALQRASLADDPSKRRLLSPGKPERLKFTTTFVSRQMLPGSRLFVLVDASNNPQESVPDTGEPLRIEIRSGSHFEVPLDSSFSAKPVNPQ